MSATLLPEAKSVFVDPEEAGRYLLPLATIDASHALPHLNGPLHFVMPIDPYDGVVGEATGAFHSETCTFNFVGFNVVNGLYSLDTDYQFFEQRYYENHPVRDSVHESVRPGWIQQVDEHYARTTSAYKDVVTGYRAGDLTEDDMGFVVALGGQPIDSNWSNMGGNFSIEFLRSDNEEEEAFTKHPYPLTSDGRRYDYIGTIDSAPTGPCRLLPPSETLLFYDAPTKRALLTFDWT